MQGGPARYSRKQTSHRATHQERGARLLGLWASQARHGNPVWFTPYATVNLVAKLSPALALAGLDRHAQQPPCGGVVSSVGFLVMPAKRSLEESANRISGRISNLRRPPVHRLATLAAGGDRCARHKGRETVRIECQAFHLQLWSVKGLVEVPASSISKTMACWSLCVYYPHNVHDYTRGSSDSQTNVRSTTELPCRPLKVGTSSVLSSTASRRVSGLVTLHPHSIDHALKSPAMTRGLLPRASSVMFARRAENSISESLGGA
uniref:Uncharacterized protein n=1 Tax=Trichogramma kaykai TaxID=54128 RepID=A0ABD2W9L1_9HYME